MNTAQPRLRVTACLQLIWYVERATLLLSDLRVLPDASLSRRYLRKQRGIGRRRKVKENRP